MSFLKAQWNNLALLNFEIDAKLLEKYLPNGTEIDFWNGKCFVSLVGFMFENVKLKNVPIPFHENFEEVNLRFYVKRFENGNWKRGVVFIKEIVPKPALSFVANMIYKENYQCLPMKHTLVENDITKSFSYQWKNKQKWNSIAVVTEKKSEEIETDTEAEFITEHYFGYTKANQKTTFEYEVKHPRWEQYKVIDYTIEVDFETTYGADFTFLQDLKPCSFFLAKGSEITVENKKRI